MASKCYIERMPNILSKMLRIRNHNTRILAYAAIVFASLSVMYFLAHQASCQLSDVGLLFCELGFNPFLLLITVSAMTPGGTVLALAVAERNLYEHLYDAIAMVIIGFFMGLIGLILATMSLIIN